MATEIIVYRNPVEAVFWHAIMAGDLFLGFSFTVMAVILMYTYIKMSAAIGWKKYKFAAVSWTIILVILVKFTYTAIVTG